MGHPIDLKRDENSHFKKIWLFQILEEMKASRDENVLQNGFEFEYGHNSNGYAILVFLGS